MADVLVHARGQLGIGAEGAEQHVGVAVPRVERVVRVVGEAVVTEVVRRPRLRLLVVFEVNARLEVVAPLGDRQVVRPGSARAHVQARERAVAVVHVAGQVGAVSAGRREDRGVRPLVDLRSPEARELRRIRIVAERLQPGRVDAKLRCIERGVVEVLADLGLRTRIEAPAVVRVPEVHLVDDIRLEHLRDRRGRDDARRVVRDVAGSRREVVVAPHVVPILQELEARAGLVGERLIDAHDVVGAAVFRRVVVRRVRRPLLPGRQVQDPVGHRQQVEHRLSQRADAIQRNDVVRERHSSPRVDDLLDGAVRDAGLREVAGALECGRKVGPVRDARTCIIRVLLRHEEVRPLVHLPAVVSPSGSPADRRSCSRRCSRRTTVSPGC